MTDESRFKVSRRAVLRVVCERRRAVFRLRVAAALRAAALRCVGV